MLTWNEEPKEGTSFKRRISLARRNISSIDVSKESDGKCSFTVIMNSGKSYTKRGECKDILSSYNSMKDCMTGRNGYNKYQADLYRPWRDTQIQMYDLSL